MGGIEYSRLWSGSEAERETGSYIDRQTSRQRQRWGELFGAVLRLLGVV